MAKQNKRIKVLFTIPNFDTAGSGKALLNIATRLDANRFDVHIMCMHDRGDFFQVVKQSGIPVHLLQYTTPMKPYGKGLWNCWQISRSLKKIAPDIIHSFHYSSDYSEALAAKLAGIHWIYTKKNMSWGGSSKNAWKLRSYMATRIAVQNTDMIKQFFPDEKKVALIPRGVNVDVFAPGLVDLELRVKYGVKENERIIICVANLVPVKGIEVLINAFQLLVSEFPHWKVWIVGDDQNEYGLAMRNKVESLSLDTRIIFTGKQLHVKSLLDQADIFVLPTLHEGRMEGSPVSLLEAMANGKVIVASDIPGIRDQLKTFERYQFMPKNHEDLSRIISSLIKEDNLKMLGQRFMEHAKNFTIEREVIQHAALYESIVR